jgi:hypothetical protein
MKDRTMDNVQNYGSYVKVVSFSFIFQKLRAEEEDRRWLQNLIYVLLKYYISVFRLKERIRIVFEEVTLQKGDLR